MKILFNALILSKYYNSVKKQVYMWQIVISEVVTNMDMVILNDWGHIHVHGH